MVKELEIKCTQEFMGINIPVIEGGFGENYRVVTNKIISEIHNMRLSDVNASINRLINRKRLKEGIDFINILSETVSLRNFAKELGMVSSNRTKDAFILSERGYSKLIKSMDDDKSWDIMDKFIDEYFSMKEIINSNEQLKAKLLLSIYNGGQDAVIASKKLSKIEVEKATAPLIEENKVLKPKAEYHDNVLNKNGLLTTTVIAKDLGFRSAIKLNQVMTANKIIFKNSSGIWHPYADYEWLITDGYADYQSYDIDKSKPCLKWTEKGRKWIIENYDQWVENLHMYVE